MTTPQDVIDLLAPLGYECTANHLNGGHQVRATTTTGWGLSIVRHAFSYGSDKGSWEIAVVDADRNLRYDTPLTRDVIGRCDLARVEQVGQALQGWLAEGASLVPDSDERQYETEDDIVRLASAFQAFTGMPR